jgi:hypothetical protein
VIGRGDFDRWQERKRRAHDASASETSRYTLRFQVRRRAKAWGLAVPPWAAVCDMSTIVRTAWAKRPRKAKKTRTAEQGCRSPIAGEKKVQRASAPRPAKPIHNRKRVPPTTVKSRPRARSIAPRPFAPVELPGALSAWRKKGEGRIVHVSPRGVELHELGRPVQRFRSVDEALSVVT